MDFSGILPEIAGKLDMEQIRNCAVHLQELERAAEKSDFRIASDYLLEQLAHCGIQELERLPLICDGVTAYDDETLPPPWEQCGRSTLEFWDAELPLPEKMLCDSALEPLTLARGSAATPEGGITAELLDWHLLGSADWQEANGKIVLCDTVPSEDQIWKMAHAGAVGLVYFERNLLDSNPDDVCWMDLGHSGIRALWAFSLTPRHGVALGKKLASGESVNLHATVQTKTHAGETYTITGRLPGRSRKELVLFASIYKPFVTSNCAGAAGTMAILKAIHELAEAHEFGPLEYSIRVVLGWERTCFLDYLKRSKAADRVLGVFDLSEICLPTLEMAGIPLDLHASPASAPDFTHILLGNLLLEHFPELYFRERAGNLSGNAFPADAAWGIPVSSLTTPAASYRRNSSGRIFSQPDWRVAQGILACTAGALLRLALKPDAGGVQSLTHEVLQGIRNDAKRDFERLRLAQKAGTLHAYATRVIADFLVHYHSEAARRLKLFTGKEPLLEKLQFLLHQWREKAVARCVPADVYALTPAEARMAYLRVEREPGTLFPMALLRLPEAERHRFPVRPTELLLALLDGKRNLYETWIISNFMLKREAEGKEIPSLLDYFRKLSEYGYFAIHQDVPLTKDDLEHALKSLHVKHDAALVVHSAFAALGGVEGGPRALAEFLADYCGKKGTLLVPSFNIPNYIRSNGDVVFDVNRTPSSVGIVSEEFRKLPEVYRSLNPSHSIAVYGKKNIPWIIDHHKTLTMGSDSPLGKLERAGGYALMIGCPDAVTFMHVVEMTNRVHCLGLRNEEMLAKLPDGRTVPVRTWGWRGGHCRAYNGPKIYEWLRKHGKVREVMVRHSLWQYFKLSDYRKAYEKVVLQGKYGCMHCAILPRVAPRCVPGDWDPEREAVRPATTAFTGDWEPDPLKQ